MNNTNPGQENAGDLDSYDREKLWDIRTVAAYIGVTERTVRIWCQQGRLSYFKIGRTLRFRPYDVDRDLARFVIQANR